MSQQEIILVTGANTGLGYQTVRALYSSDKIYHVLLGGRALGKASAAAKSVADEFTSSKSKLTAIQIDIEDDVSIQRAFNVVKENYGHLDVLINNAGEYA